MHREKIQKVKIQNVVRTKSWRIILLLECEVCGSKNSKFIKEQDGSGLLSSLEIKGPSSKTPLLGPLLF